MASKTDMLIAKALSTDSEDEAIACLKMARKQGDKPTVQASPGRSSEDWEALARKYHKVAYENQEDLKRVRAALQNALLSQTAQSAYNSIKNNDTDVLKRKLVAAQNATYQWKMI